jgi:hypothetical protein
VITSVRSAGRALGGFSGYLLALGAEARPGDHQPGSVDKQPRPADVLAGAAI